MRSFKRLLGTLLILGIASACKNDVKRMEMYVVVPEEKVRDYIADLKNIVGQHGMTPNTGFVRDGEGALLSVLEGTSGWWRLFSANSLLSGREDPAVCGKPRMRSDPGQYYLTIQSRYGLVPWDEDKTKLLEAIAEDLRKSGYIVQSDPLLPCSPLARGQA
jgi:hypothetical protein